jgi:hypothetical protein
LRENLPHAKVQRAQGNDQYPKSRPDDKKISEILSASLPQKQKAHPPFGDRLIEGLLICGALFLPSP